MSFESRKYRDILSENDVININGARYVNEISIEKYKLQIDSLSTVLELEEFVFRRTGTVINDSLKEKVYNKLFNSRPKDKFETGLALIKKRNKKIREGFLCQ